MEYNALREGTILLDGTYEIKKVLGQGGFGITYLAFDRFLEKYVAIKEFFPNTLCGRDSDTDHITLGTESNATLLKNLKDKFIKEAKNIAKLGHRNIINIYFTFQENNTAYYVMEYIEGCSLSQMVKGRGPLSVGEATDYIKQIGSALEDLHVNHMAHLDVKPANIMVRKKDNRPILIDFGLSKNYDDEGNPTTTTNTLGVSPGFSPPEQYMMTGKSEFSPQSDLYSLAATYYYLLTGQVPMESPMNVSSQMYFPDTVPYHIKQAIIVAMSTQRALRQPSVKAFIQEITAPQSKHPLQPRPGDQMSSEATMINRGPVRSTPGNYRPSPSEPLPPGPVNPGLPPYGAGEGRNSGNRQIVIISCIAGTLLVLVLLGAFLLFSGDEKPSSKDNGYTEVVMNSEYGPFANEEELKNFLTGYYGSFEIGKRDPSYFAEEIETDFGSPMKFSRDKYLSESERRKEKQNFRYSTHDIKWNTVQTSVLADGGIEVSFMQIYDLTCEKNGYDYTREYELHTTLWINSNRQVYKIKESSKKLSEW